VHRRAFIGTLAGTLLAAPLAAAEGADGGKVVSDRPHGGYAAQNPGS